MAAVLGTAHMAAAPPATGLRLADALVRAQAASPVVQAAAADLDAARGRLRQARLIPANPVLSADLARHSAPGEDTKDRGVQLEQEIEVGGQRGLRIAAADHDVAHAGYLLADRRRTVDGEVRRAFFGLAAADRRQQLAAERLALAARLAEAARRRARAGEVGALDVRLAELETARAEQERTAAETERSRAAARLAVAIGAPPDEPLGVETDEQTGLPEGTEQSLVARALAARPDLAAAREERARLETEAALARPPPAAGPLAADARRGHRRLARSARGRGRRDRGRGGAGPVRARALLLCTLALVACRSEERKRPEGARAERSASVPGVETAAAVAEPMRDFVRAFGAVVADEQLAEVRDARTQLAQAAARRRLAAQQVRRPEERAKGAVTLEVGPAHDAVVVPVTAVVYDDAQPVVFVEEAGGRYTLRAVKLGIVRRDRVEIASGVEPGARVVVTGAASLLSATRLPPEGEE